MATGFKAVGKTKVLKSETFVTNKQAIVRNCTLYREQYRMKRTTKRDLDAAIQSQSSRCFTWPFAFCRWQATTPRAPPTRLCRGLGRVQDGSCVESHLQIMSPYIISAHLLCKQPCIYMMFYVCVHGSEPYTWLLQELWLAVNSRGVSSSDRDPVPCKTASMKLVAVVRGPRGHINIRILQTGIPFSWA